MPKTIPITIRLTQETIDKLGKLAVGAGCEPDELVAGLINDAEECTGQNLIALREHLKAASEIVKRMH